MNSNLKLTLLLLVSFFAVGSIVYQVRARRPKAPVIAKAPRGATSLAQLERKTNAANASSAPSLGQPGTGATIPAPTDTHTVVPAGGWGRNPFLTRDEILKLSQPVVQTVVETPTAPVKAEPAGPPAYAVTAIIYGPNGSFAVVNSRVVHQGDRLGNETVKEIRSRAVVLEFGGQTRELPLKRTGTEIQLDVPKGD